jgi:hypothetical protein
MEEATLSALLNAHANTLRHLRVKRKDIYATYNFDRGPAYNLHKLESLSLVNLCTKSTFDASPALRSDF